MMPTTAFPIPSPVFLALWPHIFTPHSVAHVSTIYWLVYGGVYQEMITCKTYAVQSIYKKKRAIHQLEDRSPDIAGIVDETCATD